MFVLAYSDRRALWRANGVDTAQESVSNICNCRQSPRFGYCPSEVLRSCTVYFLLRPSTDCPSNARQLRSYADMPAFVSYLTMRGTLRLTHLNGSIPAEASSLSEAKRQIYDFSSIVDSEVRQPCIVFELHYLTCVAFAAEFNALLAMECVQGFRSKPGSCLRRVGDQRAQRSANH